MVRLFQGKNGNKYSGGNVLDSVKITAEKLNLGIAVTPHVQSIILLSILWSLALV